MRWIKFMCLIYICLIMLFILPVIVKAEENESNTYNQDITDMQLEYDYSDIDKTIKEYSDYGISFQEVIDSITNNSNGSGKGLLAIVKVTFSEVIKSSKTAIVQILILAFFSAAVSSFGPSFNEGQVSEIARMIISISLVTVLAASFYTACVISGEILDSCVAIYKSIVPVFFSAVAFASGSTTAAVYYEIVLLMVTVVNIFFKNVLFNVNKMSLLLALADSVTKESRFSKSVTLLNQGIKWSCKTAVVVFTGLGGIKGMLVPMSEQFKRSMAYKAFQFIPGVGSSMETVSEAVIGAGSVIKNGIGTAAIVIVLMICFVPVLKLLVIALLFRVTAAVIEPVVDKKIAGAVESLGTAVGMLIYIVIVAISLFLLLSAMIVLLTNP